jgi:hypothetical protein
MGRFFMEMDRFVNSTDGSDRATLDTSPPPAILIMGPIFSLPMRWVEGEFHRSSL